jgi:hypothetical protein
MNSAILRRVATVVARKRCGVTDEPAAKTIVTAIRNMAPTDPAR